ncbi:ferredoxin-thioredoxin reductase catalytic domain-containing protein [Methanohalobium sp.]|uniref:ferredoxin-thioredoxin reductase catalytic domain-containing protein n=1 Tax=Methanohalobium sp. TaxID=2837493 RepID=UPI0025E4BE05|nr:ferredoxin-thioredoxin reductase catalytic domain-containing protein [Methanohalobium sp.]
MSSEARTERRKNKLRELFTRVVDPLGYKFSPDEELVDFLLEQEVMTEREKGAPYCPCQALPGNREEDMKLVCPCIPFNRKHFDIMKRCWCGLFVHKDVTNPDELEQISPKELEKMEKETSE